MQDLIQQEQFELEVLDRLQSGKFLSRLAFGGGTMLRLCFGLNRFSVDLDFWIIKDIDVKIFFRSLKEYLSAYYDLRDAANKFYTILFELRSKDYPRSLKIEIRKIKPGVKTEPAIAYSPYATKQVLLSIITLEQMMMTKTAALIGRKEIRDAFDIEFLLKKGIKLNAPAETLQKGAAVINAFTKKDYTVKLGSLLEEAQRKYYIRENFKILQMAIQEKLSNDAEAEISS